MDSDNAGELGALDRTAVLSVKEAIQAAGSGWEEGTSRDFGGLAWKPDLERPASSDDPLAVLHVHLAARLRPYVVDRFMQASLSGADVHLAAELSSLYDADLLAAVVPANPLVHVITSLGSAAAAVRTAPPLTLLTCLAMNGIKLPLEVRRLLARTTLDQVKARRGTAFARGRRFEGLVVFLLSQTEDFRVVEHNLRTATEEIDGVVQQLSLTGRAWSSERPYILIEGKDTIEPVDQAAVSLLRIKVTGRRPVTRLGMLFSSGSFTKDAIKQELRFTLDEATIVLIDRRNLEHWIDAEDPDGYLETLVRRAQLD